MSSTYTDKVQIIVVKSKYAYHYKNDSLLFKSEFTSRKEFIDKLYDNGFTRCEDYKPIT